MPAASRAPSGLRLELAADFDPVEAVRLQRMGRLDPTLVLEPGQVLRATHTPQGPATLCVRWDGARMLAEAWGDGAAWALERAPLLCGAEDRPHTFTPEPRWLADLARRYAHVRLGRALRSFDTLVAYVLQQRVAFIDAAASWRRIVECHGAPAPGPHPLRLPLTPEQWRALSAPALAAFDVDGQRARIVREVALHHAKLDRLDAAPLEDARALLPLLRGIGPWTAGMALGVGHADPDAVATGDVHLPGLVSQALTGRPHATDAEMLALLEPYRGHRFRLVRLLFAAGYRRPNRGARRALMLRRRA